MITSTSVGMRGIPIVCAPALFSFSPVATYGGIKRHHALVAVACLPLRLFPVPLPRRACVIEEQLLTPMDDNSGQGQRELSPSPTNTFCPTNKSPSAHLIELDR